jgi:hypothetical protein
MEKLPKYNIVMSIIDKIKRFINQSNLESINSTLENLLQEFDVMRDPQYLPILQRFTQMKDTADIKLNDLRRLGETQTRRAIRDQRAEVRDASKATKVYVINPTDDPVWISPSAGNQLDLTNIRHNLAQGAIAGLAGATASATISGISNAVSNMGNSSSKTPISSSSNSSYVNQGSSYGNSSDYTDLSQGFNLQNQGPIQTIDDVIKSPNYENILLKNDRFPNEDWSIIGMFKDDKGRMVFNLESEKGKTMNSISEAQLKRNFIPTPIAPAFQPSFKPPSLNYQGSLGFGISKKRVGRPRGSGIVKVKPPPKPANYIGFGINEIHQIKLNDGILKIRRNTKSNYMDMPARRISKNLQGVIKTMIGGGMPKYEELGKLDEDEKEYLHKIVSRSNMMDKLSIPAPSKDQQEKDIHQFEIMKGQIMSGNDSKEMVRKFKLLTRKLSKQGLLPKADVEDINDILTDLGY